MSGGRQCPTRGAPSGAPDCGVSTCAGEASGSVRAPYIYELCWTTEEDPHSCIRAHDQRWGPDRGLTDNHSLCQSSTTNEFCRFINPASLWRSTITALVQKLPRLGYQVWSCPEAAILFLHSTDRSTAEEELLPATTRNVGRWGSTST